MPWGKFGSVTTGLLEAVVTTGLVVITGLGVDVTPGKAPVVQALALVAGTTAGFADGLTVALGVTVGFGVAFGVAPGVGMPACPGVGPGVGVDFLIGLVAIIPPPS